MASSTAMNPRATIEPAIIVQVRLDASNDTVTRPARFALLGLPMGINTRLPTRAACAQHESVTWFVRYIKSAADYIVRMGTPEQAIETACRLLDDGCDVYGVGTGPLTDSIGKDEIARIYDMWVRARPR
jgi:hypothetical protein